jgi:hypothetical protein
MVYLGRCNSDNPDPYWCLLPENHQLSDFNIWSKALSVNEMEDWTTCRCFLISPGSVMIQ